MTERSGETLNISTPAGGIVEQAIGFEFTDSDALVLPTQSVVYLSKIATKGSLLWLPDSIQPKGQQNDLECTIQLPSSQQEFMVGVIESPSQDYAVGVYGLVAPVANLLKRDLKPELVLDTEKKQTVLEVGPIKLEKHLWKATTLEGVEIDLTKKELELLEYLMVNSDIVCSRPDIYESVWGGIFRDGDRSIDVKIKKIREKLSKAGQDPKLVESKFGVGYLYNPNPEIET